MDDSELMQRWQLGDQTAFETLVQHWQQPIARFIYRLVGRAEIVQDLCQEVFVRLYQAKEKYREQGSFRSWLYHIALNVVRDDGRKRPFPSTLADEPICDTHSIEDICQQRELTNSISTALAKLPEQLRMVIALRHDEGLSFEEIARITETPASTWKSRFVTAIQRLRVALQQMGYNIEELKT